MVKNSVLILEDKDTLYNVFSLILTRRGLQNSYHLTKGASIKESLSLLHETQFQIILLDYDFISQDEGRIIAEIHSTCPEAKCILVTEKREPEENIKNKVKEGSLALLNKSFQDEELLSIMRDMLNIKENRGGLLTEVYNEVDECPFEAVLIDDEYKIIYANKHFNYVYGQCIGRKCYDVVGNGGVCRECQVAQVNENNACKTFIRHFSYDNNKHERDVKERISPVVLEMGDRKVYILTFSDPGSDVIMPEPVLQQLTHLKELDDEKLITFALDVESRVVFADSHFCEFLECSREDVMGRPIGDFLYSYLAEYLVKEDTGFVEFARGASADQMNIDFISRETGKRKTLICEFKKNIEKGSCPWDLLVVARDAERYKLLSRLIEFMEEASSQLLSGNFDMFVTLDQNRKIQSFNPSFEKKLGCRRSDILRKDIDFILADERDRESLEKAFEQSSAINNVYNLRIDIKHKDKLVPTLVNVRAIQDRFNNDIGYALVIRDIEKDLMMESTLPRIERMQALGELAATTAHQINNYMDGIFKGITLLEMDIMMSALKQNTKKEMGGHINMIRERSSRLSSLTKHLTNYARSQKAPVISLGSVNAVILDVVELVKDKIKAKKAVMETKLSSSIPPLYFSPIHLEQAVINMVMNAHDALPDTDGNISVSTFIEEAWVCISIKDNGSGIPEDIQPDIFKAFKTTKPVGVGTGLGLKLAKDIVSSLNGLIELYSEVGKGTEFIIKLPINKTGS